MTMQVLKTVTELRQVIDRWRSAGERIAFVPTMGHLHAGHLSLLARARQCADRTIVSIFVNPMQFNDPDDFLNYPKTLDGDCRQLQSAACDLLFLPDVDALYPFGQHASVRVSVPMLSEGLCGAFRPGHFDGVATIVCKLFNLVMPDVALFGEKDLQQLRIIERLVADLNLPVDIIGVPTLREADGLAMSSRNAYLSPEQRRQAPALYEALCRVRQHIRSGGMGFQGLEGSARQWIDDAGLKPEYVSIRRWSDLGHPSCDLGSDVSLVVLAAAWLGNARLIDNLPLGGCRMPADPKHINLVG